MEGVPIGVRNPHIAIMKNPEVDEREYDTPIKLAKAINLKIKPKVNSATLYADDGPSETSSTIGEVDVELEVDKLVSDKKGLILGSKKDSNGVLIESSDDIPPYLALGFQVQTTTGMKFSWLYKGKFEPVEEDYKTKGDKVDFQTPKVKATFLKRACDNMWKSSVVEGDEGVAQNIFDNWFKAVYESTIDFSVLNVNITPADKSASVSASSDVVFTFNKAIQKSSINQMNAFLLKSDGSTVNTSINISNDGKVITLHPATDLAPGTYIPVCTTGIKDIGNLSLVQNLITSFTV